MGFYQGLAAWRGAHGLALAIYSATRGWPSDERFGLTIQARRAAVSIAANLAEGATKRGPREFRRFLDSSLGSLAELDCLLLIARDLAYLDADQWSALESQRHAVGGLVWRLYRRIAAAAARPPT